MDFCTLANIYREGNNLVRLLRATHLAQQLEVVKNDPKKLGELSLALESLETNLRVLGMTPLTIKAQSKSR